MEAERKMGQMQFKSKAAGGSTVESPVETTLADIGVTRKEAIKAVDAIASHEAMVGHRPRILAKDAVKSFPRTRKTDGRPRLEPLARTSQTPDKGGFPPHGRKPSTLT